MLKPVNYDQQQFDVYVRGRELPPETIDGWRPSPATSPSGGPSRCSISDPAPGASRQLWAQAFGGPVYGVEPADQMRAIAEASAQHPQVTYLAGAGEQIPLPDDSCDVVMMYLSFHHFKDQKAAAREIARVLRPSPGGQVLIRSTFGDRVPDLPWYRYFPRAPAIEKEVFRTVDEVTQIFSDVGLRPLALEQVRHRFAPSLNEYAAKLHLRAISTFEHLTEDELAEGFAALDRDAAAETEPQPCEADCDLLVLGH